MTEINTYPPHVQKMKGADNRIARAELRSFLIEDYIEPNTVGAEIGVAWGDFSHQLITQASPKHLYLIDPWFINGSKTSSGIYRRHPHWRFGREQDGFDNVYDTVVGRFKDQIDAGQVTVYRLPSLEAASKFEDESLDWVYVDGDHCYDAVKADLNAYLPKVKKGGMILGDDYRNKQGNVGRAVHEFVDRHNLTLKHSSSVTLQYAIQK